MPTLDDALPGRRVIAARNAVAVVFVMTGFAVASWMSRIPQVRTNLDFEPSELGRILLAIAIGSLLAMPTAGFMIGRFGTARLVAASSVIFTVAVTGAGLGGDQVGSPIMVAVALFLFGYGIGTCDVSMNVEAAAVEGHLGRTVMPKFHAAFSLGTVVGAGLGAAATALEISVGVHLVVIGLVAGGASMAGSRWFLPRTTQERRSSSSSSLRAVIHAWREPRTLAIGVVALSFALIEGIANDWLAIGLIDGYEVADHIGTIGFAAFVTSMTIGRLLGTSLIDRFGRAPVMFVTTALVAVGTFVVVFGGSIVVAMVGVVIWGLGASLGFPLAMSAAADDPGESAARVSVVASVGYTAFLAGPPVLGYLGDHEGVLRALLVVVGAAMLAALAAPSTRAPRDAAEAPPDQDERGRTSPVS